MEDILASLAGGKSFSKLDLAHAYQQLVLDEESKKYTTTINTDKGLYQYNRLTVGVSAAPAIFQRTMENILQGLPKVCVYIDDILVTGQTEAEYLQNLHKVLTRIEEAGMRLKRAKCKFLMESVEFLGHVISAEGVLPNKKKVEAVLATPTPKDVSQVRSFLGLMNYYGRFLPNLSSVLAPLYRLLHKAVKWRWHKEEEDSFREAKELLISTKLLVHFDPDKELILTCDARRMVLVRFWLTRKRMVLKNLFHMLRAPLRWQKENILNWTKKD